MNVAASILIGLVLLLVAAAGATRLGVWAIERRHPPQGEFATVNDTRMHFVHVPAGPDADLPPLVFLHGASGNLLDQMLPVRPQLEGRAELLFPDRPGHGWSERGSDNATPFAQVRTIAALMEHLGMKDAIVIGHSFGGAVAAAFALEFPERTRGLVFLSAATHPWPGAATNWYYRLSSTPVLGRLFVETLAWFGGTMSMRGAIANVFAPNPVPEPYELASIPLVLRPSAFRANALDVQGLFNHVSAAAPRYSEIAVPTVVITGDSDTVVYEEIHSEGLARDIPHAELVWVKNLGHKPDWIAPDLVVAAIEKVAGRDRDLTTLAGKVEARIAGYSRATELDQNSRNDPPTAGVPA